MTKVEYIESKRIGITQLIEKLQEYYESHDNSFESLSFDELINMARKIDVGNFKNNEEIWFERCRNCNEIKPYDTSN